MGDQQSVVAKLANDVYGNPVALADTSVAGCSATLTPIARAVRISVLSLGISVASNSIQAATIRVDSNADNGAACTLRDAVTSMNTTTFVEGCANSTTDEFGTNDRILLNNYVGYIGLGSAEGEMAINTNMVIEGAFAAYTSIRANGSRIFNVSDGVTLALSSLTLSNGSVSDSGGCVSVGANAILQTNDVYIRYCNAGGNGGAINGANGSQITLNRSTLRNNSADTYGGAIRTFGTLNVTESELAYNSAGADGGAIYGAGSSTITISRSGINRNSAGSAPGQQGGGVWSEGVMAVDNSTFYANSAFSTGGAIEKRGVGALTLSDVTISGNTASGSTFTSVGSAVYVNQSPVTINNSIIANSVSPLDGNADCTLVSGATATTDAASIIESGGCNTQRAIDPGLADYYTSNFNNVSSTVNLLSGAAAINTGNTATCDGTDQRGITVNDGQCDVGASEFRNQKILVDTNIDNPGGLVASDVTGCSLREAFAAIASGPGEHYGCTVTDYSGYTGNYSRYDYGGQTAVAIDSALSGQTLNLLGGLELTEDANVYAYFQQGFTINGQGNVRNLKVSNSDVRLGNLSLINGFAGGTGDLADNSGGGLYLSNNASVNLTNSSISGAVSDGGWGGGAVYVQSSELSVNRSTISGNSAINGASGSDGGAIYAEFNSRVSIRYSTIANNQQDSSAVFSTATTPVFYIRDSIIADSVGGQDCGLNGRTQNFVDDFSIVEDGSCGTRQGDPGLLPLANNDAFTLTHALDSRSTARDSASQNQCLNFSRDQRGELPQGRCDVGAFEAEAIGSFFVIPTLNGKFVIIEL